MALDHLAHEAPKPLHERHLLYGASPVLAGTRAAGLQPVRPISLGGGLSIIDGTLTQTEWVSVTDPRFGATGDGTTDDSAAIQAAIDSLGTGGGTVFFPKASYVIGTAIDLTGKSNLELIGQGGVGYTANSTKIVAKATLTGPMFTCDTADTDRASSLNFYSLYLEGNQQDVDGFYIHGDSAGNLQSWFIKFERCVFKGMRTGAWLGDYTNETPNLTFLLGVEFYACIITDCVTGIKADAGGFDGLKLNQTWILDLNDRMVKGITVLTNGTVVTLDSVWIGCGDSVTHAIYFALPNSLYMRDCAIEANASGETFVGLYMPTTGGASQGGVIIDNVRLQHTSASAVAIDVDNAAGMEIRSSYFQGDVNVGSSCRCIAENVTFSGSFTFTGTLANVFVNGEASSTWTPSITFNTPGDLSVAYSVQLGSFSKVGRMFTAHFEIVTSTFTHTTASGGLVLSGLPGTAVATYSPSVAIGAYSGITASSGTTEVTGVIVPSTTTCIFYRCGSGIANVQLTAADMPTGGTVKLSGSVTYRATT